MQTASFLTIVAPFLNAYFVVANKPSDPIYKWGFQLWEAMHAQHPFFHHHWQVSVYTQLLFMVQTCDNPFELGGDYMGDMREVQSSAAWLLQL